VNESAYNEDLPFIEDASPDDVTISAVPDPIPPLHDQEAEQPEPRDKILELFPGSERTLEDELGISGKAKTAPSPDMAEAENVDPGAYGEVDFSPPALEQMVSTTDPFAVVGLDAVHANEIVSAAGLYVSREEIPELIAHLQDAGLSGPDDFREFVTALKAVETARDEKAAQEQRLAALEARLEDTAQAMPGSPLESRLDRIERMLTEQREQEAQAQQFDRFVQERSPLQAQAWDMLTVEAQQRGMSLPNIEEAARIGSQLLHLPPMEAARIAWVAGGGDPSVTGSGRKVSRRDERVVLREGESLPNRSTVIPSGPTGRPAPTNLEDMLG